MSVYLILAIIALLLIAFSFVPGFGILHKLGSALLALDLVFYFGKLTG